MPAHPSSPKGEGIKNQGSPIEAEGGVFISPSPGGRELEGGGLLSGLGIVKPNISMLYCADKKARFDEKDRRSLQ